MDAVVQFSAHPLFPTRPVPETSMPTFSFSPKRSKRCHSENHCVSARQFPSFPHPCHTGRVACSNWARTAVAPSPTCERVAVAATDGVALGAAQHAAVVRLEEAQRRRARQTVVGAGALTRGAARVAQLAPLQQKQANVQFSSTSCWMRCVLRTVPV